MKFDRDVMQDKLLKEFEKLSPEPQFKSDNSFIKITFSKKMIILLLAVLFIFIVILFFSFFKNSSQEVIIKADNSPVRIHPVDPGGMVIPHKDSTVYNTIKEDKKKDNSLTTKTLPKPEEPLISEQEGKKEQVVDPLAYIIDGFPEKTYDKKVVTQEAPLKLQENLYKQKDKLKVVKESQTRNHYRVQLGSFKKREEAVALSEKLPKIYPSLFAHLTFDIEQALIENRGIFYRVKAGPFKNESAARQFCQKITHNPQEQGCFVVFKKD